MTDKLPDTCSTRVPITLRKTFGAESREERENIIATLEDGMRGAGFTPDDLKTRLSKMTASHANGDFAAAEVTLYYWAPGSQYAPLEIQVLSEPNPDPGANPEDRCSVQYQFHQWELPKWLSPWELTIGNGS